jgi:hypothetical protein
LVVQVTTTLGTIMQELINLPWIEPKLIIYFVRMLEAFGRFVGRVRPTCGPQLLLRLFAFLESLPVSYEFEKCGTVQKDDNNSARQKVRPYRLPITTSEVRTSDEYNRRFYLTPI